jgi:hypothetical protein
MPRKSQNIARRRALLAAAIASAFPACARATNWTDGTGNWSNPANWSAGVPTNGSTVNINETDGVSRTINYDYTGAAVTIGAFTINLYNGAPGAVTTFSMTANNITTNIGEIVGGSAPGGVINTQGNGTGAFIQTGGVNTNSNALDLGLAATDSGYYALGGGTMVNTDFELVGVFGTGTLFQSGGVNSLNGSAELVLGDNAGSTGTYTFAAGSLFVGSSEIIGNLGNGSFLQARGLNTTNLLYLGMAATATGSYSMTGTPLVANDESIGQGGAGIFNQSAGTNTVSGTLGLGISAGSSGTYNLSASGTLSAIGEYIAPLGSASFVQSGGLNQDLTIFAVGVGSGSTGTYSISNNGSLAISNIAYVGLSGTGSFNQSGGTVNAGTCLLVGFNSGGVGNYTLSAGSLNVANGELIGEDGVGIFNQSGGTHLVSTGNLVLGDISDGRGSYTLGGSGTLSAPSGEAIGLNGAGSFTQFGGANLMGTSGFLHIGYNTGSTGSYTLDSGLLTATDEDFGLYGSATFVQNGGSNIETGGGGFVLTALTLGGFSGTGSYTLNAGTLVTTAETIAYFGSGTFNQTGGLNDISNSGLNQDLTIGSQNGSHGTYNLSGGVFNISSAVSIYVGFAGDGILNVSGGILDCNSTIFILSNPSPSNVTQGGTLNFSGGTIIAPDIALGQAPAAFNWTGGTLELTSSHTFDPLVNAPFPDLFGASLLLNGQQTLLVTGNETLGGTGAFSMELGAGSFHSVSGTLTVTSGSTLTQDAGSTLAASTLIQQGTINGFLQNQGEFIYMSGAFNGELINQGTVNLGPNFTAANGIENDATMTLTTGELISVNGLGLDNLGTFSLGGATLSGSGPVVNDFSGTMTAHGNINNPLTNLGTLTLDGVLHLNGGGTNSGTLTGSGTIFGNFSNPGGNIALPTGNILSISSPWTNAGLVTLSGGLLGGGTITNTATIQGTGSISAPINNDNGVIRGAPGELDLQGAANTNGSLGQIQIPTGSTVLFTKGLTTNSGTIALTGGTFDNNNKPLTNTGSIVGAGTFRSGGLTNNGIFNLTGNSTIFGTVTNSATGQIHLTTQAVDSFFGAVNNSGSFTVDPGSSATFFLPYAGGAITNNGQITFGATSTSGKITGAGNLSIGSSTALVKLKLNTNSGTSTQSTLTINTGSTFDLANNTFAINYASPASDPITTVVAQLKAGYNSGTWTGAGIASSTAAANPSALAVGYADGNTDTGTPAQANQVLLKYTLSGDANLDGLVNFNDLVAVVQNFNKPNTDWSHGNFLYGPSTNFNDLVAVVQNFNKILTPAGSSGEKLGNTTIGLASPTDVQLPEPAAALAFFAAGCLLRRRSSCRK